MASTLWDAIFGRTPPTTPPRLRPSVHAATQEARMRLSEIRETAMQLSPDEDFAAGFMCGLAAGVLADFTADSKATEAHLMRELLSARRERAQCNADYTEPTEEG